MYIDLVMVTTDQDPFIRIYEAPPWSGLKNGNEVSMDDGDYTRGTVCAVCTIGTESPEYSFILKAFATKHPLKQLQGMYEFRKFFYKEGGGTG